MKRNLIKSSIVLVIVTALASVLFSILFYIADEVVELSGVGLEFLYYTKRFFDLIAVFAGYAVIVYAFARYEHTKAYKSIFIFCISIAISYIYQVIATCVTADESITVSFVVYALYFCLGGCVITQLFPAILIAFLTSILTRNGSRKIERFFNFKNPIQKSMGIMCLIVFALNVISYTFFTLFPLLASEDWIIDTGLLWEIILAYVELVVFYIVIQYVAYVVIYKLCDKFDDMPQAKSKRNKNEAPKALSPDCEKTDSITVEENL